MHSCYVYTEKFSFLLVNSSYICLIFLTYPPFKLSAFDTTGPWLPAVNVQTLKPIMFILFFPATAQTTHRQ